MKAYKKDMLIKKIKTITLALKLKEVNIHKVPTFVKFRKKKLENFVHCGCSLCA